MGACGPAAEKGRHTGARSTYEQNGARFRAQGAAARRYERSTLLAAGIVFPALGELAALADALHMSAGDEGQNENAKMHGLVSVSVDPALSFFFL